MLGTLPDSLFQPLGSPNHVYDPVPPLPNSPCSRHDIVLYALLTLFSYLTDLLISLIHP